MNKKWIVAVIILVAGIVLVAGFLVFQQKPTSSQGSVLSIDDAAFPEIKYSVQSGCLVPDGAIPTPTISGDFATSALLMILLKLNSRPMGFGIRFVNRQLRFFIGIRSAAPLTAFGTVIELFLFAKILVGQYHSLSWLVY